MAKKPSSRRVIESATLPLSIEFVLDETGSMYKHIEPTIGGFNDFLIEQQRDSGECRMTLTKFSASHNHADPLRTPFCDLSLGYIPQMTRDTFGPSGGTNLYDAICSRAASLDERLKEWTIQPRVLFVVMTDGVDTMSRLTASDVHRVVDQHPNWTFVFLGADQDALAQGTRMGFHSGNIKSFQGSEMRETMQTLSKATTVFRTSSLEKTRSFF